MVDELRFSLIYQIGQPQLQERSVDRVVSICQWLQQCRRAYKARARLCCNSIDEPKYKATAVWHKRTYNKSV